MYNEYFGFKENPFNLAADFSFFWLDANKQDLSKQILNNLQTDFKPVILTGPMGTGKSQLIHYVISRLPEHIQSVYIADGRVAYPERIRLTVVQMSDAIENGRKLVVIIDDAQEMQRDDLKLLLAAATNKTEIMPPFHLMLSGLADLNAKLDAIGFVSCSEHNTHRHCLSGLDERQVDEYIRFRLQRAGYSEATKGVLFSADAVKRIAALSLGVPHSINLLCGASLLLTSFDNHKQVTQDIVQEASLSCLLPSDEVEPIATTNILSYPKTMPEQLRKPVVLRRRVRQSRRFNQRITHLQRLGSSPAQIPGATVVASSYSPDAEQAKRKRLVRGLMTLGLSLSFLIGLQSFEKPNGPPILVSKLVTTFDKQLTVKHGASFDYGLADDQVLGRITVADAAHNLSNTDKLEKIKPVRIDPAFQPKMATEAQTTDELSESKTTQRKAVEPVLLAQTESVAQAITKTKITANKLAIKEGSVTRSSVVKPLQFQQVSAEMPGLMKKVKPSPVVNFIIDTQEAAAKERAFSRLNLNKLGVDYSAESLMTAAQTGDSVALKLLLRGGVPADIKNKRGETALIIAARNGYKTAVKELLKAGAHTGIKDKQGLTALMYANQQRRADISDILAGRDARG